MFRVLENNEPAVNDMGWSNADFEKWPDAVEYLRHWVGDWKGILPVHPKLGIEYRIGVGRIVKIIRLK